MSLFDNRTDTEKELENYRRQNNGNSSNGYTQNNGIINKIYPCILVRSIT